MFRMANIHLQLKYKWTGSQRDIKANDIKYIKHYETISLYIVLIEFLCIFCGRVCRIFPGRVEDLWCFRLFLLITFWGRTPTGRFRLSFFTELTHLLPQDMSISTSLIAKNFGSFILDGQFLDTYFLISDKISDKDFGHFPKHCYHRFPWYATFEIKTPAEMFPKFPSIIQSVVSNRQHVIKTHYLIGYQTSYVNSSNLKVCSNVDVKPCFARLVTEVFWLKRNFLPERIWIKSILNTF